MLLKTEEVKIGQLSRLFAFVESEENTFLHGESQNKWKFCTIEKCEGYIRVHGDEMRFALEIKMSGKSATSLVSRKLVMRVLEILEFPE